MNDAAGHFFISRYSGFFKTPYRHFLLSFILGLLVISFPITLISQDYQSLKKDADNYYEKEQFYSAAQFYQVAVGLEPDHAEANYRLAQSYRAIFNYSLAAIYYEKALSDDVYSYPLAPFYLAQMNKSLGKFNLAIDQFQKFIDSNEGNEILSRADREKYLEQARIGMEGCYWAIQQLNQGWIEQGFNLMPEPVNSPFNDYAVAVAQHDSSITVTSGRRSARGALLDNRYGDYFTDNLRFEKQDSWRRVTGSDKFNQTNTKYSDGAGTYNSEKNKYYFTSCYEDNAFCQLYVTELINGRWRTPKLLNQNINYPGYDNRHPCLTPGGDTLIFVSNRPGGVGGNDLWFSLNKGDDEWQTAQLLPGKINTPFNEITPYYFSDGTFFFSSDGHIGFGGMDIFMVNNLLISPDIVNLGLPINSGFDDNFLSIGNNQAFLSSNRLGGIGKFDIYSFGWPGNTSDLLTMFTSNEGEGEQLGSRIRDYESSNLFQARDEDQFYYDNLTAEERALIDRVLAAKRIANGNFNPKSLEPEDFKFYRKLDIETKAIIERLAQRKAMTVNANPLVLLPPSLDAMEQADWAFYENAPESDKAIIDRIIAAKIEDRQELISEDLSSGEQQYWNSIDSQGQVRIETQAQIQNIDTLVRDLQQQSALTTERSLSNQTILNAIDTTALEEEVYLPIRDRISREYAMAVSEMNLAHQVFYKKLSPVQQNDLHRLMLQKYVSDQRELSDEAKELLLEELGLREQPSQILSIFSSEERALAADIVGTLTSNVMNNPHDFMSDSERLAYEQLTLKDKLTLELQAQQMLLQQGLEKAGDTTEELQVLKGNLQDKSRTGNQLDPQDIAIEDEISKQITSRSLSFVPRKLTPKEAFFFQNLTPSYRLSLDRLSNLVQATNELPLNPTLDQEIVNSLTSLDRSYLMSLPFVQQQLTQTVIKEGLSSSDPQVNEYLNTLDPVDQQRLARLHGSYLQTQEVSLSTEESKTSHQTGEIIASFNNYLDQLSPGERQYYDALSPQDKLLVQNIVSKGTSDPASFSGAERKFLEGLSPGEKQQLNSLSQGFVRSEAPDHLASETSTISYRNLLSTEDREYLENLSAADQEMIDFIIASGTLDPQAFEKEPQDFLNALNPIEQQRLNRVLGASIEFNEVEALTLSTEDIGDGSAFNAYLDQLTPEELEYFKNLPPGDKVIMQNFIIDDSADPQSLANSEREFLENKEPAERQLLENIISTFKQYEAGTDSSTDSGAFLTLSSDLQAVTGNNWDNMSDDEKEFILELSDDDQRLAADIITQGSTDVFHYGPQGQRFLQRLDPSEKQMLIQMIRSFQQTHPGAVPARYSSDPVIIEGEIILNETASPASNRAIALIDQNNNTVAIDSTDASGTFVFKVERFQAPLEIRPLDKATNFHVENWSVVPPDESGSRDAVVAGSSDLKNQQKILTDTNKVASINPVSKPIQGGAVVYFDFDSYYLRPEAEKTIEELSDFLNSHSEAIAILVAGHADFTGPDSYNQQLSVKRSNSVAGYLRKLSPQVLASIKGFGESQPQESNSTRFGRQFNRRVELHLQGNTFSYQPQTKTFLIKPGVSLRTLAEAIGVTESSIMELNGLLYNKVRPYQPLRLPLSIKSELYHSLVFDPLSRKKDPPGARYHLVQYGETLFRLAIKYQTSVQELEELNNMGALDLKAGQRIRVR